jgi:hypothetical protein
MEVKLTLNIHRVVPTAQEHMAGMHKGPMEREQDAVGMSRTRMLYSGSMVY